MTSMAIQDDVEQARNFMRPFLALYIGGMGSRDKNFYNQLVTRYGYGDAARRSRTCTWTGKQVDAMAAIPGELIDKVALCGSKEAIRERLAVYRDAGVGTLLVTPTAESQEQRLRMLRDLPEVARLKVLIGAFGDPGHAFPAIALGRALRARGHDVTLETWQRWREHAGARGAGFAPAPEYQVFPTRERPLKPYAAAARAALETRELVRELGAGRGRQRRADARRQPGGRARGPPPRDPRPALLSAPAPGLPPFGLGALPPRTRLGRAAWAAHSPDRARRRARPPGAQRHPAPRRAAAARAALRRNQRGPVRGRERSRSSSTRARWPAGVHVTGPADVGAAVRDVELPPGEDPLVVVAPSTSQDPRQRLLRAALEGLAGLPVRVLATYNRRPPPDPVGCRRTRASWSGCRTRARCRDADIVILPRRPRHARPRPGLRSARCSRFPPQATWARTPRGSSGPAPGLGLPNRFLDAATLRWAVQRVLEHGSYRAGARSIASWSSATTGRRGPPGCSRNSPPRGRRTVKIRLHSTTEEASPGVTGGQGHDREVCGTECNTATRGADRVHLRLRRGRGDGGCRPRGGRSDVPHCAGHSDPGQDALQPDLAISSSGATMIVLIRNDGTNYRIQSRYRDPAGNLGPVDTLSAPGETPPSRPSPSTPRATRSPYGRATPAPT